MCEILLNSVDKVKRFVNIVSNFEICVFLTSGRYVIDAKSIMGIFSIDLAKPVKLTFDVNDSCDKENISEYMKLLEEFIV